MTRTCPDRLWTQNRCFSPFRRLRMAKGRSDLPVDLFGVTDAIATFVAVDAY